jgi:hypothetical protein
MIQDGGQVLVTPKSSDRRKVLAVSDAVKSGPGLIICVRYHYWRYNFGPEFDLVGGHHICSPVSKIVKIFRRFYIALIPSQRTSGQYRSLPLNVHDS